ncbi:MAG: hypothetical protein IPJ65_23535 [Archangiaceae bacterium]|nr:hypothetical protein [Archangiaceae bacterium]
MTRLSLVCLALAVGCGSLDASRAAQLASPLCQAKDAKAAFGTNAVCVCEDLALVGAGLLARSPNGGTPANVGVNGVSQVVGRHEIGGSLISMRGITGVGEVVTGADLSTTGDVAGVGHVTVGHDMMVGGRVDSVGVLEVKGTLGVQGETGLVGQQTVSQRGGYVAPSEPCGCGTLAVDVGARVAEARSQGARLAELASVGKTELTLSSGTYWAESLTSVGELSLTVDGAVALAIDGDLTTVGRQHIRLTAGSTLDLYVRGGISTVGGSLFGENATPGSVRIFLGSEQRASVGVGAQTFNASIYAPRAELALVGDTTIAGSVFAKSITGVGRLTVEYAAPVAADPEQCVVEDPPPGRGSGSGDPSQPGSGDPLPQ